MLRPILIGATLFACLAAGAALAESGAQEPSSAPSIRKDSLAPGLPAAKPYLGEEAAPDIVAILPPPPAGHSAAEKADQAAFMATRTLEGSQRWALATADVAEGSAALLDNFACVLGQRLDPARVPALMSLLDRTRLDLVRATRMAKRHYRRLRPFVGNDEPICVARDPALADSFSYPSGHSMQGWAYAMIMASLMPERATQFLVRGRLYGESRVVCGVHWMSDVVAARTGAASVVAALQGDAGFRADLERARRELAGAMATEGAKPDAAVCTREENAAREPLL